MDAIGWRQALTLLVGLLMILTAVLLATGIL